MDENNEAQEAAPVVDDQPRYTQKQLNDLIAKESDKRLAKVLKEYGLNTKEELGEIIAMRDKTAADLATALERAETAEKIKTAPQNVGRSTSCQQRMDTPDLSALVRARM